jgi:hypothetical protein
VEMPSEESESSLEESEDESPGGRSIIPPPTMWRVVRFLLYMVVDRHDDEAGWEERTLMERRRSDVGVKADVHDGVLLVERTMLRATDAVFMFALD